MATALKTLVLAGAASKRQTPVSRPRLSALLIVAADVAALSFAITASAVMRHIFQGRYELSLYWNLWPAIGLFAAAYAMFGLYPGLVMGPVDELRRASGATTVVFLGLGSLTFMLRVVDTYSRIVFLTAWLIALMLVPLARSFVRHRFGRRPWWGYPVLVFGAGRTGHMLVNMLQTRPELGLRPRAVLADEGVAADRINGVPVIQSMAIAPLLAREWGISHAIVAMPTKPRTELLELMESHASTFSHVLIIPDLDGVASLGIQARDLSRLLTLEVRKSLLLPGPRLAKRAMDVLVALSIGLVTLPFLLLIALLIKLESHGPALYGHDRIGREGAGFRVWKFRSMVADADRVLRAHLEKHPELRAEWERDQKLRNDPRVTRIGRVLRKTSLDELPQLWNVLCGQMSLVGPRPIVYDEISKYGDAFSLYTQVLPGLTGMWQVSGRNDTGYGERVALDMYYVRNWSPWLDVYLLARTVTVVLRGSGAY